MRNGSRVLYSGCKCASGVGLEGWRTAACTAVLAALRRCSSLCALSTTFNGEELAAPLLRTAAAKTELSPSGPPFPSTSTPFPSTSTAGGAERARGAEAMVNLLN